MRSCGRASVARLGPAIMSRPSTTSHFRARQQPKEALDGLLLVERGGGLIRVNETARCPESRSLVPPASPLAARLCWEVPAVESSAWGAGCFGSCG